MSKRPTAGYGPLSSVRSLVGYLRDRRIGIKLGFILFVPTLATVIVGANGLVGQISTANTADRARTLATLSGDAGVLVHELQNERANSTMLLGLQKSRPEATVALKSFNAQVTATDAARGAYTRQSSSQANLPDSFKNLLGGIQSQLGALPKLREEITHDTQIPLTLAVKQYDVLITGLLAIRDSAAQLAGDSTLSYEMRAAAALSNAKEFLSQERVVVLEAILQGSMPPEQRQRFIATLTGQQQALTAYAVVATPIQQTYFEQTVSGPPLRPSEQYESQIESTSTDSIPRGLQAGSWDQAMSERANLYRTVEQQLDATTVSDATTLRDNVQRQIIVDVGLLFGMVLLAVMIAWFVARSMNRSLRELKHGALTVARYGLPQAVARLRDPALSTQLTPHQIALQIAEPLPVRSRDEFGEVTEAFNAVHLEAVRTAAEQAALRSSVATMFVNLARRSQLLVDRLIGHLDRLERGEEDPDRLAELFQLDHLATRMRRNDENLLVLAGADSTRVQREPAALMDVLRAAQSEVEHYTRIEFGVIDRDLEVAAHAVNDLVHLIAELFDNATAFSPPDAAVIVEARRVGDRAVLYVEDHGIGVSADQLHDLNERLATPPLVDVAVSRMMGLVVVARLAARHGVKVELRPASERGTIADVLLPTAVLIPRALSGRGNTSNMLAAADPLPKGPQIPPTRSPFGPPLALESGSRSGGEHRNGSSRNGSPNIVPTGAGGAFGGFAATVDSFGVDRPDLFNGGSTGNRALPSWSDLTGAGTDLFNGHRGGAASVPPLPQRRAGDQWSPDPSTAEADPRTPVPRQRPHFADRLDETAFPEEFAEAELLDDPYADDQPLDVDPDEVVVSPIEERIAPTSAPPVWPPVHSASPIAGSADETGQLSLGQRAMSLDMTAEIPRIRDLDLAGAVRNERVDEPVPTSHTPASHTPASHTPAYEPVAQQHAGVLPFADETMELPIFRELESAWFRVMDPENTGSITGPTGGPSIDERAAESSVRLSTSVDMSASTAAHVTVGNGASGHGAAPTHSRKASGTPAGTGTPTGTRTTVAGSATGGRPTEPGWRSAADDGWIAAAAAAEAAEAGVTEGGLPKRVPMAQLVPGGVDKSYTSSNRRSPDAVRGLLSAYHRGVQRGRQQTDDSNAPDSTTTGYTSPGGKEQEA